MVQETLFWFFIAVIVPEKEPQGIFKHFQTRSECQTVQLEFVQSHAESLISLCSPHPAGGEFPE